MTVASVLKTKVAPQKTTFEQVSAPRSFAVRSLT
jgi:hypothetical protein